MFPNSLNSVQAIVVLSRKCTKQEFFLNLDGLIGEMVERIFFLGGG